MSEETNNMINLADYSKQVAELRPIPTAVIDKCQEDFPWLMKAPKKWQFEDIINAKDVLGRVLSHGDRDLQVIASITVCPQDNETWLHVSISRESRRPNYDDVARVKHTFVGPKYTAYEIFPPAIIGNKMNRTNRHIWCPITKNPMPEFTRELIDGLWKGTSDNG